MNKRYLNKFAKILKMMRDESWSEINQIQNDNLHRNIRAESGDHAGYSTHMADMAGDEEDLVMNLQLLAAEEDILEELDEALERIEKGTYGICGRCGGEIGKARLTAKPFARYCLECRMREEIGR